MTDDEIIATMIAAFRHEQARTRSSRAPKGQHSYAEWATYDCFRAVLAAVRECEK